MNWPGPTLTDSGGFQVLSLGAGFRKVLAMDTERVQADDIIAEGKERLAHVDDDGVTFRIASGRLNPPVHSRGVDRHPAPARRGHHLRVRRTDHAGQHPRLPGAVGAAHPRLGGAVLIEHRRLAQAHPERPPQALFGVVQGAQYEDLRRQGHTRADLDRRRRRAWFRWLRHRRSAGEAEPGHHRRLGQQRAARRQAAPPAGNQ